MGIVEVLIFAVILSIDAFAVAVCKGLALKKITVGKAAIVGAWFGTFQALMPLIGYFVLAAMRKFFDVDAFDHWISFGLLLFHGIRMIIEAKKEEKEIPSDPLGLQTLVFMAIATSIDALAAGVTIAAAGTESVLFPAAVIGVVAFIFSFAGLYIGNKFGDVLGEKAEVFGGIMLIFIGTKTLIEHLFG